MLLRALLACGFAGLIAAPVLAQTSGKPRYARTQNLERTYRFADQVRNGLTFSPKIDHYYFVNSACKSAGVPKIKPVKETSRLGIRGNAAGLTFMKANFPPGPLAKCNGTEVYGDAAYLQIWTKTPGTENIAYEVHFPNGDIWLVNVKVTLQ